MIDGSTLVWYQVRLTLDRTVAASADVLEVCYGTDRADRFMKPGQLEQDGPAVSWFVFVQAFDAVDAIERALRHAKATAP